MDSFMAEVSIIMKLMRLSAERGLADRGLGFPEQMVLMCLYPDRMLNQDAVARMLGADKGAVARTIAKLQEKGLIVRGQNPDNRRENLVSLAPESFEVLCEMQANLDRCMDRAFEGFSDDERAAVVEALGRISANLSR